MDGATRGEVIPTSDGPKSRQEMKQKFVRTGGWAVESLLSVKNLINVNYGKLEFVGFSLRANEQKKR